MHRFRAWLLLIALLSAPIGLLAASFSVTQVCCDGNAVCPMHRHPRSQRDTTSCHGNGATPQLCMCAAPQQTQLIVQVFGPGTMPKFQALPFTPAITSETFLFEVRTILLRVVSPPDLPP